MTAQVIDLVPMGDRADDTIRRTIDAIVKGKGLRPDDVAAAAGMSRSTYFAKMAGHGTKNAFKAGEVALIANYLEVPVSKLFDGLGGTFIPPLPPEGGSNGRHPEAWVTVTYPTGAILDAAA